MPAEKSRSNLKVHVKPDDMLFRKYSYIPVALFATGFLIILIVDDSGLHPVGSGAVLSSSVDDAQMNGPQLVNPLLKDPLVNDFQVNDPQPKDLQVNTQMKVPQKQFPPLFDHKIEDPQVKNKITIHSLNSLNIIPIARSNANYYQTLGENMKKNKLFKTALCGNFESMTSAYFSRLQTHSINRGKLAVTVHAFNNNNKPKTIGGDVIVLWAEQVNGTGRASGRVKDNLNGSYTGYIPIVWNGQTHIRGKILSLAENTCLRFKALQKYGNAAYSYHSPGGVNALFIEGLVNETTRCGPSPHLFGYKYLCNFTKLNDNTSWYCGAPHAPVLNCHNIYSFPQGPFYTVGVKANERVHHISHTVLSNTLTINIKADKVMKTPLVPCRDVKKRSTWTRSSTSGYFSSKWKSLLCSESITHSNTHYRQCLNGKTVMMFGDSTIRQYYEYLCKHVLHATCFIYEKDFGPNRTYNSDWVINSNNVSLSFRRHELPFHNPDVMPNNIRSVPNMIKDVADGPVQNKSLVVLVHYFSHFVAYGFTEYRQRLSTLVKAIKYLLMKKPKAKIILKGPHVFAGDRFCAKFAQFFQDIMFEEFQDVMNKVIYINTWDIAIAHNSENLHPEGECFQSHIQQFMSFVCD